MAPRVSAVSRLTLASLFGLARVAGDRRLTIATGPDGARWAAWPYGCIALTDDLIRQLNSPLDGTYRMYGSGTLELDQRQGFGPELVVREMLPRLNAQNRSAVAASPWMYQHEGLVRRLLERSDGDRTIVDQELWQAWSAVTDLLTWQVGSKLGLIVWAGEGEPGVAGLLPVFSLTDSVAPDMAVAA